MIFSKKFLPTNKKINYRRIATKLNSKDECRDLLRDSSTEWRCLLFASQTVKLAETFLRCFLYISHNIFSYDFDSSL